MADEKSDVTFKLSRWASSILATLLVGLVVGSVTNVFAVRDAVKELQFWRSSLESSDSILRTALPRTEWAIEKQYLHAELEQLRARIVFIENRERP